MKENITKIIGSILLVLVIIFITVIAVNIFYNKNNKSDDLLMTIEDVFEMEGLDEKIVFVGRVMQGNIKIGDEVEVLGLGDSYTSTVVRLEELREEVKEAKTGESVGVSLDNLQNRDDIKRGQVVIKPKSMKSFKHFKADIEFTEEIESTETINCFFRTLSLKADLKTTPRKGKFSTEIVLENDMAMEVGTTFELRNSQNTKIGTGTVSKVYES